MEVKLLMVELKKSQQHHNRIIQKQLQMSMIKKYLKKDIYHQKKDINISNTIRQINHLNLGQKIGLK